MAMLEYWTVYVARDISGGLVASAAALKYDLNERTPKGCAKVRGSGWLGLLGALPEMWKCILKYEAHSHWATGTAFITELHSSWLGNPSSTGSIETGVPRQLTCFTLIQVYGFD